MGSHERWLPIEVPVSFRNPIFRFGKGQALLSIFPGDVPTHVIGVDVGNSHNSDFVYVYTFLSHFIQQTTWIARADTRVDEDRLPA